MANLIESPITVLESHGRTEPPTVAMTATATRIERVYRHRLPVRIGHWLNVVCLFILIGSGLQIFNAHPALYWGDRSDRDKPLLSIRPI